VPLGLLDTEYLEDYAPKNWVTDGIEINVTNLTGMPSIVYGLLALDCSCTSSASARAFSPPASPWRC